MAHLVPIFGRLSRGYIVTGQNLADLDESTKVAIDGTSGGTYAPSNPIIIGGAGMVAGGNWRLSSGARVEVDGTPDSTIAFGPLGAAEAFVYGPGHTEKARTLLSLICEPYTPYVNDVTAGISAGGTVRTQDPGVRFLTPLRVHAQGVIETVTFRFRVSSHANVPAQLPQVRVVRVSTSGVFEALRAADLTTSPDGFISVGRPVSGAAWYATGNPQSLVYTCNQNATVDKNRYLYFGEIIEESGTNSFSGLSAGTFWCSMACAQSGITMLSHRH